MSNPYRIRRPSAGIAYQGEFRFDGGLSEENLRVAVSYDYLWLNDNLSIPLATITDIETAGDRVVRITYYNALADKHEQVGLTAFSLLGKVDQERVWALANALTDSRARAGKVEDFLASLASGAGGRVPSCEKCGSAPAAVIDLAYVGSIGVMPIVGAYVRRPFRRLLCRRHAVRACLKWNAYTSIAGFIGFPGILTAPLEVWRNTRSVARGHKLGAIATVMLFMSGWWFSGPVVAMCALVAVLKLVGRL
ncbi:MAG: hypothetical protein KDB90_02120 [Planctomycetes bacterium]|nr:hypothetical protein [Planctomycetota bacterium]